MIIRIRRGHYDAMIEEGKDVFWASSTPHPRSNKLNFLVRRSIAMFLQENSVQVNEISWLGECPAFLDLDPNEGRQRIESYKKWTVESDSSIEHYPGGGLTPPWVCDREWEYTGVELKTPAFRFNRAALDEITTVIELIRSRFDAFTNVSCGLHIHVGNNGHDGFPMQTLRNFCKLVTVFEQQICSLHPDHRIANEYCTSPGLAMQEMSLWERALTLEQITDLPGLCRYFNRAGNYWTHLTAYNLFNLDVAAMKTIEFRQHAGSLEPLEITTWAETVVSLLGVAHLDGDLGCWELIQDHIGDENFSVIDLFQSLGMFKIADYYRNGRTYDHPRDIWLLLNDRSDVRASKWEKDMRQTERELRQDARSKGLPYGYVAVEGNKWWK